MLPKAALLLALASPLAFAAPTQSSVPSLSTLNHLRRRLFEVGLERRDEVFSNSTSLDKSFHGAVLFKAEIANVAKRDNHPITQEFANHAHNPITQELADHDNPAHDPVSQEFVDHNNTPHPIGQEIGNHAHGNEHPISQEFHNHGAPVVQAAAAVQGIEIVCSQCYTRGTASASLTIKGDFNSTKILDSVEDTVSDTIDQLVEWVDHMDIELLDREIDIPAPNISFNVDMETFPECMLEFKFDGLEVYMQLDTTISSGLTYQFNLFKSTSSGIQLAQDLFLGLVFSIDLILSADSEITMNSGFHIKIEDGALLRLALFSDEMTDMVFNGGKVEFLPVTVESAGSVFRAILQLSLRSGFALTTPDLTPGFNIEIGDFSLDQWSASAGLETRVFANIAEMVTNVTNNLAAEVEDECVHSVAQAYTFGVGAAAGATVRVGEQIWGPTPATSVPLYYTTLAEFCAEPTASGGREWFETSPNAEATATGEHEWHEDAEATASGEHEWPEPTEIEETATGDHEWPESTQIAEETAAGEHEWHEDAEETATGEHEWPEATASGEHEWPQSSAQNAEETATGDHEWPEPTEIAEETATGNHEWPEPTEIEETATGDHEWPESTQNAEEAVAGEHEWPASSAQNAEETASPVLLKRDEVEEDAMTTTTLEREVTYTAVACASTGLVDCPASLQTHRENIVTETLTTRVSDGVEPTWPDTTEMAALSTVEFGDNSADMVTTTGRPEPYNPEAAEDDSNDVETFLNGETGGVSNRLILGLSIGLGVPFLISILTVIICCCRRRRTTKYKPAASTMKTDMDADFSYKGASEMKEENQSQESLPPPVARRGSRGNYEEVRQPYNAEAED